MIESPTMTGAAGATSAADLAELMRAFNEVTSRLERTHEDLRSEVARLNAELGSTNAQLARAQRLAALGEMAAGIAHEVRNPLASIRLDARLLREDLAGSSAGGEGSAGLVARIERAVRDADAIVNDVLAFAREIRVRPAEAGARAMLIDAARIGAEAGAEVRVEVDERGDETFECDAGLVRQALANVVRNAVEACADARHRGVDAGLVRLDARRARARDAGGRSGEVVVLRVRDDGPGVTEEVVERMFNPFFTTRPAGTGLGLAIVHRIVDAHAGCVRVRNNADDEPGARGACVELQFPRRGAGMEEAG